MGKFSPIIEGKRQNTGLATPVHIRSAAVGSLPEPVPDSAEGKGPACLGTHPSVAAAQVASGKLLELTRGHPQLSWIQLNWVGGKTGKKRR